MTTTTSTTTGSISSAGIGSGLDVKAMRTTTSEEGMFHLAHSLTMFKRLLDIVRGIDEKKVEALRAARQYEQLEMLVLNALTGRS